MKKIYLFLVLLLCLNLSACDNNIDNSNTLEETDTLDNVNIDKTSNILDTPNAEDGKQEELITDSKTIYFESDEVVNQFFSDYNAIAEVVIPTDEIDKGNIRTKALVYIDDLSLEIVNANDFLSVSISSSADNENTTLYPVFRDTIKAINTDISDNDIKLVWNAIHETGYLVEGYDFYDMSITYVPYKELSYGTSDSRLDLEFPLSKS